MASCVAITRRSASPRAIAVVLGPLRASDALLERLADLYYDCNVVAAASPPRKFMLHRSMHDEAQEVLQVATQMVQDHESEPAPLILHAFSNGGCFLLDEIEQILADEDCSFEHKTLFCAKLKTGCQIFDSCPCYIRMAWDVQDVTSSFPHPSWSTPGRFLYTLGASWSLTAWCTTTLAMLHPQQFWTRRMESRHCLYQVYVYSTCDMLSDAAAVDRLIAHRQQEFSATEASIVIHRYEDSSHCRLHVDHPQDYVAMLDQAIQEATQRNRRE